MLTTIIFFFALLLSLALLKRMMNDSFSTELNPLLDDGIEPALWIIVTILWSWLYYLSH